jgi:hypothetical protein
MMKYLIQKQGLTIGSIILLVGTTIVPSVAQNEAQSSMRVVNDQRLYGERPHPEGSSRVHLGVQHLPLLTTAIHSVRSPFYRTVLSHIRETLVQKGSVDDYDLDMITTSLNITNLSFYAGYMTARGETGNAFVLPFTLIAMTIYSLKRFYAGPILIGTWGVDWASSDHSWEGVSFTINGREELLCKTSGIAIGGVGGYYRMVFEKAEFDFFGIFLLIIVNKNPL